MLDVTVLMSLKFLCNIFLHCPLGILLMPVTLFSTSKSVVLPSISCSHVYWFKCIYRFQSQFSIFSLNFLNLQLINISVFLKLNFSQFICNDNLASSMQNVY